MTTREFEKKIQKELNPSLTVVTNPNYPDIAGVHIEGVYPGVAVPPNDIYEEPMETHRDSRGFRHATVTEAMDKIRYKLSKMSQAKIDMMREPLK